MESTTGINCSPPMQLLMVPTPFFIGVCSSFLRNVHEVHVAEVWLINLDTKEVCVCIM